MPRVRMFAQRAVNYERAIIWYSCSLIDPVIVASAPVLLCNVDEVREPGFIRLTGLHSFASCIVISTQINF